ncbi:MAG: hypothetical protein C0467_30035 [Planctomycetaceae bacterium]|nr:hypothetical protein [Planctomycetaceae bacterium]
MIYGNTFHAAAAKLELFAALLAAPRSGLDYDEWNTILSQFKPRVRRVVILHGLMRIPFPLVGERLEVSRGRCDQLWREALPKLAAMMHQFRTGESTRSDTRHSGQTRVSRKAAI